MIHDFCIESFFTVTTSRADGRSASGSGQVSGHTPHCIENIGQIGLAESPAFIEREAERLHAPPIVGHDAARSYARRSFAMRS